MNINDIILKYQRKGILLYLKEGKLFYEAPKGVLDNESKKEIKLLKEDIVHFLEKNKEKVIIDNENKYKPFNLTDIQSAYMLGSNDTYKYGGTNCKVYSEFKYPLLNGSKLQKVWEKVVANNDMLHAVIKQDGTQEILKNYKIHSIKVWDMSKSSDEEIESHFTSVRERLTRKKYIIGEWPLYDLEVTNLKESSILHLSLDMLIADFTSINIITNELEKYYFENIPVKSKELSYRDVIIFNDNEKRMTNYKNKYEDDRKYWNLRINQLPEAPEIPLIDDLSESNTKQYNLFIDKDRKFELEEICKKNKITISNLILGVYTEVLRYWSERKHFCINITMAERKDIHREIKQIIGDFTVVNLLEISECEDETFSERLGKLQKQLWNDMDHSSYSGVQVLRDMSKNKKRNIVIPYVYTSTLSLQSGNQFENFSKHGQLIYKISQTPQVLLDCQVLSHNDGILISWDFKDVFPKNLIYNAFDTFSNILTNSNLKEIFNEKDIIKLSKNESLIRKKINNTNKKFDNTTLFHGFCKNVMKYPEAEAIKYENVSYSYEDLAKIASSIQQELKEKGCKKGDIVAINLEKGVYQIASVLGTLFNGAIYLPIDIKQPLSRKNKIFKDANVKYIITSEIKDSEINLYWNSVNIIDINKLKKIEKLDINISDVSPKDTAYVIYTSGSTGDPKGVVISHKAAMNTINDIIQKFEITRKDKILCISNLAFDLSVFDIFGILTAGGTLVLPNDGKNILEWNNLINDNDVTIWNTVPAQMEMLLSYLKSENLKGSSKLRLIMLSGDWIPVYLHGRISEIFSNAKIVSLGGATEASIWSIYHIIDPKFNYKDSIPYGVPLSNQELYILDSKFNECPNWIKGTIYISGEGLAEGYLNDELLTNKKFIYHDKIGKRLYNTGDFGRYNSEGVIQFLGRKDGQVKIRGHRVELNEIQSVINSHPRIENSIVVISEKNEDVIGAFIQTNLISNQNETNIRNKIKENINYFLENKEKLGVLEEFKKWVEASNKTALLDIIEVLQSANIFVDNKKSYGLREIIDNLKIKNSYEPLLKRWLKALEVEGYICKNTDLKYKLEVNINENSADNQWLNWKKIDEIVEYNEVMMNYFSNARNNLLPLLRGEKDPIELFFPEGSFEIALSAYKENKINNFINKATIKNVVSIVKDFTSRNPNKKFKILEIGAGVGGVSIELIEALKDYPINYLFTDISRSFLNKARKRFEKYPWVEFNLYDINKDYWKQNIIAASYDLILCNNVLHNANNILLVMKQLKEMIKPNGFLLILDETENNYTTLTSVEFLNGLNNIEDFRKENDQVFLNKQQWKSVINNIGGELISVLPEMTDNLNGFGQTIFVINFESNREPLDINDIKLFLKDNLPEYMIPNHIEILEEFPLNNNGKIDRKLLKNRIIDNENLNEIKDKAPETKLEKKVAEIWRDILNKDLIYKNSNFYEIGGDSLLATQIVASMKENIEEVKHIEWNKLMVTLIENPTIEKFCNKLLNKNIEEITQKSSVSDSLIILNEKNSDITNVLFHDGTGTISPYNQLIPSIQNCNENYLALISQNKEEFLNIQANEIIPTLGRKYAKILLDTGKKSFRMIGYCMGGLIAMETAKALSESGAKIEKVITIDTRPSKGMIYNELLMERLFGLIIGSDVKKAGHKGNNDSLKKFILTLGDKYGNNVSNNDLINVSDKFYQFKECYKKLNNISKEIRLKELIHNMVKENNYNFASREEQLYSIYEVFCHSFKSVMLYNPDLYFGDIVVLTCEDDDSGFMPISNKDNIKFWEESVIGKINFKRIKGNHLTCMSNEFAKDIFSILNEEK